MSDRQISNAISLGLLLGVCVVLVAALAIFG